MTNNARIWKTYPSGLHFEYITITHMPQAVNANIIAKTYKNVSMGNHSVGSLSSSGGAIVGPSCSVTVLKFETFHTQCT